MKNDDIHQIQLSSIKKLHDSIRYQLFHNKIFFVETVIQSTLVY